MLVNFVSDFKIDTNPLCQKKKKKIKTVMVINSNKKNSGKKFSFPITLFVI